MKPRTEPAPAARPTAPTTPEPPAPDPAHRPAPVDMAEESVAGEEDPGASIDLAVEPPLPPPSGQPPRPDPQAEPPASPP